MVPKIPYETMICFNLFDNITDYKSVETIHYIISLVMPVLDGILIIPGIIKFLFGRNIQIHKQTSDNENENNDSGVSILMIVVTFILISLIITTIISNTDGRYIKQSITESEWQDYIYYGQVNNAKPHGFGKLFDSSNNTIYYVGNFVNDKKDGEGKEYSLDDYGNPFISYEGTFKNGLKDGTGIEKFYLSGKELTIYDGDYVNGTYTGFGDWFSYYEDGDISWHFRGYLNNYKFHQYGLFESYNNHEYIKTKYEGGYYGSKYNGYGELAEYNDWGDIVCSYNGGWYLDKKSGYGELTIFEPENGISVAIERYRGYLYNDKKEGYGVFEFRNGDREEMVFVGYFLNNDFTDEGVWYNADGVYDKYTSEYISKYPYPDDCLWIGDNRLNVG